MVMMLVGEFMSLRTLWSARHEILSSSAAGVVSCFR